MKSLPAGRNDLYGFLEHHQESEFKEILVKGRFLQSDGHDYSREGEAHWHRKILETYDSSKGVLLSQVGSRNSIEKLDIPDKYFTLRDLEREGLDGWMLRETDWKVMCC
jgi:hypothetical protein